MSSKLYVGNLSKEITEVELQEFFSTYGTVVSVRIKRDSVTGEPWGYGFIEMADPSAAELVIKQANGLRLGEHKLSIDSMRTP
jgi:RNA recognition motif-containing protein